MTEKRCLVNGCDGDMRHGGRGYCSTHHARLQRHGTISDPVYRTAAERFQAFIEVEGDGCWRWVGGISSTGYGKFWLDGKTIPAHRVSYEMHVGVIPGGMEIDHLCRVRSCVNPEHLQPVTGRENIARRWGAVREGADSQLLVDMLTARLSGLPSLADPDVARDVAALAAEVTSEWLTGIHSKRLASIARRGVAS